MGGSSSRPDKPLYLSACKCGEVQLELYSEPIDSVICYCEDCQAATYYIDAKAKASGKPNTSLCYEEKPENRGMACTLFYLDSMKFSKGQDKFVGFRNFPSATFVRSYTSCCNTSFIANGGEPYPVHFRPINANTLTVAATGAKYSPKFAAKINGKSCNPDFWAAVAEDDGVPKDTGVPAPLMAMYVAHMFKFAYPGPGAFADDRTTPGIHLTGQDYAEINPISSYHAIGCKLDQTEWPAVPSS